MTTSIDKEMDSGLTTTSRALTELDGEGVAAKYYSRFITPIEVFFAGPLFNKEVRELTANEFELLHKTLLEIKPKNISDEQKALRATKLNSLSHSKNRRAKSKQQKYLKAVPVPDDLNEWGNENLLLSDFQEEDEKAESNLGGEIIETAMRDDKIGRLIIDKILSRRAAFQK